MNCYLFHRIDRPVTSRGTSLQCNRGRSHSRALSQMTGCVACRALYHPLSDEDDMSSGMHDQGYLPQECEGSIYHNSTHVHCLCGYDCTWCSEQSSEQRQRGVSRTVDHTARQLWYRRCSNLQDFIYQTVASKSVCWLYVVR